MTHSAVTSITEDSSRWLGKWSNKYTGAWIDYALLLIFGGIPWQSYFQRVLSCKTAAKAQILSVAASFGCVAMALPAILIGAIGASTDWAKTDYPSSGDTPDKSLILPMVLQYLTPTAVSFFGLGAVSAAVMSSADSIFLSSSSMFARNIYKLVFRQKASEKEVVWVMRVSVIVFAVVSTSIALLVDSIYTLWALCSDLIYEILFPQLCCVIYLQGTNTYGSFMGYLVGLVLRIGGGESSIGLMPFIKYPYYNEVDGQLFPFRTVTMLASFATLVAVSYLLKFLFERGILPPSFDFLHCFQLDGLSKPEEKELMEVPVRSGQVEWFWWM